ncbi:hypothetical protein JW887_01785 [Candidatus Dojkabacteria bacterium]|nr:hypothetical protein [Candidatus Dojkabacteria bacterium]
MNKKFPILQIIIYLIPAIFVFLNLGVFSELAIINSMANNALFQIILVLLIGIVLYCVFRYIYEENQREKIPFSLANLVLNVVALCFIFIGLVSVNKFMKLQINNSFITTTFFIAVIVMLIKNSLFEQELYLLKDNEEIKNLLTKIKDKLWLKNLIISFIAIALLISSIFFAKDLQGVLIIAITAILWDLLYSNVLRDSLLGLIPTKK